MAKEITNLSDLNDFCATLPDGTLVDRIGSDLENGNIDGASFELPDGTVVDIVYSGEVAEGYVSPFETGEI